MRNLPLPASWNPCIFLVFFSALISSCEPGTNAVIEPASVNLVKSTSSPSKEVNDPEIADAATILNRPEVPILCYHQIRDYRPADSKTARDYIVPVNDFSAQIKSLADSGYHTILP